MDFKNKAEQNIILKVRVGSHLYGTNTPDSDLDYEGIFLPDDSILLGLGSCKEVDCGIVDKDDSGRNTKDAVDFKLREYREFVKLALQNNPNILNILFANEENIEYVNDYGRRLLGMAKYFPHDASRRRYTAYAVAQMRKMQEKPEHYEAMVTAKEALSLLCVALLDKGSSHELLSVALEKSQKLDLGDNFYNAIKCFVDEGPGKCVKVGGIHLNRAISLKKADEILGVNIQKASYRSTMWKEYGYDLKFAANLIQILKVGIELARTGEIKFPLECKDLILSIKNGQFELDQILHMGEQLKTELETMDSVLPKSTNFGLINDFVEKEMRRWVMERLKK